MTLEPTPRLRFVLQWEWDKQIRVLQQWWRDVQTGEGEWRDVPLEEE